MKGSEKLKAGTTGTSRVEMLSGMLCSPDGRRELANELEALLFRDALDAHWPATRDADCGGYLTGLDQYWRPAGEQTKSLEFIARQTCAYARAARVYSGRGYDEAARQGYAFLTEKMWDAEYGGFFTLVDRRGRPLEQGRKHPHGHLYAVDAFIEISPLIGGQNARLWARRSFAWLEDVAWDPEHGGYWGYYQRNNQQIRAGGKSWFERYDWIGTPVGLKDLNIVVDSLATLTALVAFGCDDRADARLKWYVRHILDNLIPRFETLPFLYTQNWTTAPDIPRSGQPFQLITALLQATIGTNRLGDALAACKRITAACVNYFTHPNGGYTFASSVYAGPLLGVDLTVPERSWWVQSEAARGALLLALSCPDDAQWRTAFARQWAFVEDRMIDHRYHGFYDSAEQGRKAGRWRLRKGAALNKTSIWKDVSHETRQLMDSIDWLRNGPGIP